MLFHFYGCAIKKHTSAHKHTHTHHKNTHTHKHTQTHKRTHHKQTHTHTHKHTHSHTLTADLFISRAYVPGLRAYCDMEVANLLEGSPPLAPLPPARISVSLSRRVFEAREGGPINGFLCIEGRVFSVQCGFLVSNRRVYDCHATLVVPLGEFAFSSL